ncbi:flagellar biosynthesis protein R [Roseibium sp.]|uniref:flagellar biosynthesis protein R n=1 Tax=Roseibium sp. TaxID=1936156 RepID=UPI003266AABA
MKKNTHEIARMLKLQQQLCLLSSWLLQKLDAQAEELVEREERVLDALAKGDLAQQERFIRNAAQRLKTIAEEQGELTVARAKVECEYTRQRMMLQVIEQRLARMRASDRRVEEDNRLSELLSQQLGRRTQASRKLRSIDFKG